MNQSPNEAQIKLLFTKSYGQSGPTPDQWKAIYANNVHFIDPTQERHGIDAYILAQNNLIQRCDDVYLKPHAIALNDDVSFHRMDNGIKDKRDRISLSRSHQNDLWNRWENHRTS